MKILIISLLAGIVLIIFLFRRKINKEKETKDYNENDYLKKIEPVLIDMRDVITNSSADKKLKQEAIKKLNDFAKVYGSNSHKATKEDFNLLKKVEKESSWKKYVDMDFVYEKPTLPEHQLFDNNFSDIFFTADHEYISHDHALCFSAFRTLILNKIDLSKIKNVVVYVKQIFVNHDKYGGIMWIDVYVPKKPG